MKKIFLLLAAVVYFTTIIILRKYPDNHICTFLSGLFGGVGIVFFIFMINIEKANFKNGLKKA